MRVLAVLSVVGLTACIEYLPAADGGADASGMFPMPVRNDARGIDDTSLAFDLAAHSAQGTITFAGADDAGATLEVGDLMIDGVSLGTNDLPYSVADQRLALGLPASRAPLQVQLRWRWSNHEGFSGASVDGYTLVWPYFCGNLFPCHSDPSDGTTFSLALVGVPQGKTAVFAQRIESEAPSYQIAWSIADYTRLELGATDAGTQLYAWHQPGQGPAMGSGTADLVAVFDWYERTLGPYRFGTSAGPVAASWGAVNGGMEHHPYWHMGEPALANETIHAHEAAHGWFGDGVRLQCWEDFVLSEGTVQYLASRALEVVSPDAGIQAWTSNAGELAGLPGDALVWPQGCGKIDILHDGLFSRAPYIRGAYFYRAVALKVGPQALDLALAAFYGAHAGHAATMDEMLDMIQTVTGYDPHACAEKWLRSTTIPPVGPCE